MAAARSTIVFGLLCVAVCLAVDVPAAAPAKEKRGLDSDLAVGYDTAGYAGYGHGYGPAILAEPNEALLQHHHQPAVPHTVTTVIRRVPVPVAQPYPVVINKPVAVRVPQPYAVAVPRAVPVAVPQPYAVAVPRAVPVDVPRAVPVAVPYAQPVAVPQPVAAVRPVPVALAQPAFHSHGLVGPYGLGLTHGSSLGPYTYGGYAGYGGYGAYGLGGQGLVLPGGLHGLHGVSLGASKVEAIR